MKKILNMSMNISMTTADLSELVVGPCTSLFLAFRRRVIKIKGKKRKHKAKSGPKIRFLPAESTAIQN